MASRTIFPYTLPMIINRLVGGCIAAISFILFGLVMTIRGSSTLGVEIMDRLGWPFVLGFLGIQLVVCLVFLRPKEFKVPLLLLAAGTFLFALIGGAGGEGHIPLNQALFAGASFSGLAAGILAMLGNEKGE
jgi:hypothetical protein